MTDTPDAATAAARPTFPFGQEIVWQPNPDWIESANLTAFMRRIVRAAWLGEPLGDLSSLEDPSAVDAVREAQ